MPVALPTTVYLVTHFRFNLTRDIADLNSPEPRHDMAAATDTEGGWLMKQPPLAEGQ